MKLRMQVSIAGTVAGKDFSAQPGMVVDVEPKTAKAWIRSGHGVAVPEDTPTSANDALSDLSMEEARHRICSSCEGRRGQFVLRNRSYCARCFRAEMGVGK